MAEQEDESVPFKTSQSTYPVLVLSYFGELKLNAALALAAQPFNFGQNLLFFRLGLLWLLGRLKKKKRKRTLSKTTISLIKKDGEPQHWRFLANMPR